MHKIEFEPSDKNCVICGSKQLFQFKANAFDAQTHVNIIECTSCNFAWQFPLGRTPQESVQFFEDAYKDKGKSQSEYFNPQKKYEIAKSEFEFLNELTTEGKNLLDIGAGAGIFAEVAADNGWNVVAIDPAIDIERLKNKSMIQAIKGSIDQIPENELFDVITLWDVIEHVSNPTEIILTASRYLKEGGWLVIETGNYKSADRVECGKNHWMYQLDHRWYFSPDSMKTILSSVGFSEFICSNKVHRPNWKDSAHYAGPSRGKLLKKFLLDPLHIFIHIKIYFNLLKAKKWSRSGIGIFTIAARK